MPICTHCTEPVISLYTVYESADNLRLEQCPKCKNFADPYVEHDALTLFIDLILLKRDVYRHLLFNRGLGASKAIHRHSEEELKARQLILEEDRREWQKGRYVLICKLGCVLLLIDAFVRWSYLRPPLPSTRDSLDHWNDEAAITFFRVLIGCIAETIAFHVGIISGSLIVRSILSYIRSRLTTSKAGSKGTSSQFFYAQIPLALLYSSLPKLFLLFLLSLWRPAANSVTAPSSTGEPASGSALISEAISTFSVRPLSRIFDDDVLDREWVVRNLFGGMAAGFGLRVVLDCHPLFTSMIILLGWVFKTGVSAMLSGWIGGNRERSEAWFAYSIP